MGYHDARDMRKLILFSLLIFGLFGIPSCSNQTEKKAVIRVNFPVDPNTLDPRKGRDITSSTVHFMLYEGLTRFTPQSTSDFGLAEKIELSEDRCTYTFYLRNAEWSDGHPVTSEDFEYAWKSMLDPEFPCPNVNLLYGIKNAEKVKMGQLPLSDLGIWSDGPKKFIVQLEAPIPYFLELTAFCVFSPVPSHIAKGNENWPDKGIDSILSCGPYLLKKWSHWDEMVVEKSPTYWDQQHVAHDKIKISFVENANTAFQMFERGELDMMGTAFSSLPLDVIPVLKEKGVLESFTVAATTFCTFNTEAFPFHNKNIRKAFSSAINRKDLVENITQLGEEAGVALIPSVLKGGKKKTFVDDAALKNAQEYLAKGLEELGITKEQLNIQLMYSMNDVNYKIAQELQQQWFRVLGVNVNLQNNERTIFLDNLQRREYMMSLAFLHAQYNDQMNILERFKFKSNPKNYCNWENEEYVKLLSLALNTSDEEERCTVMEQAEQVLLEEMPLTPIYHWNTTFVKQPYVENIHFSPIGSLYLPAISIDKRGDV